MQYQEADANGGGEDESAYTRGPSDDAAYDEDIGGGSLRHRSSRRYSRWVRWLHARWVWFMRRPAWLLISWACAIVAALSLVTTIPLPMSMLLRLRRPSGLRSLAFFRKQADIFQSAKQRPVLRGMMKCGMLLLAPVLVLLTLARVATMRSIVLLALVPIAVLSLFLEGLSRVKVRPAPPPGVRRAVPRTGNWSKWVSARSLAVLVAAPLLTWGVVALIVGRHHRRWRGWTMCLRWCIGDAPVGVYLVIVAFALTYASTVAALYEVQSDTPKMTKRRSVTVILARQRDMATGVLVAAVIAMCLIRQLNTRLFVRRACV